MIDKRHHPHLRSIAILSGVLTLLVVAVETQGTYAGSRSLLSEVWRAQVGSSRTFTTLERKRQGVPRSFEERIALRLQSRLRKNGAMAAPPLPALTEAVEKRQMLLGRNVTVRFAPENGEHVEPWTVSAQRYPLWIVAKFSTTTATFAIDPEQIANTLEAEQVLSLPPPINAVLSEIRWSDTQKNASKVVTDGVAKAGYMPDIALASASVAKALESDLTEISVPVAKKNGRIVNVTGLDLGKLQLIASGLSNYKNSPYSRQANVRKALNEHVNNTIVAPGETFSFNSTLGGPVSQGNGWQMAKVIYNGGDLELAPGGGICQASTTVFRAAVHAGFPVVDRKAHSLYVSYYKHHGVGIDATIYPGTQDLVFVNDTPSPLVIQAGSDGYDAFVNFYGTPDGRTVELSGPYFASSAPEGLTYNGRGIAKTEILWVQNVTYASGESREYKISSRYKELPQLSLSKEFPPTQSVHAAAPEQEEELSMR